MKFFKLAVASSLLVFVPVASMAQQNPIGGLVGGLINAAKQSAAKEEWEKVDPLKQTCFNAGLRKNNLSVQSLIQNGIGPNDPRLNQVNTACDEMINRKFRTDYECTFNINNRSIVTWCDEAYAIPNGSGGARRITVEEAINASASGQSLSMGQFEKPDAERRRIQMMRLNPSATNVPKPTWSCEKGKKPHEIAICNSYDLTIIDNQYAQYWAMIKPIDKKREFQKKADGFYKATQACNSNENCIKQSLIVAIDNAAEFLKANGTQVSSYTEQQQAKLAAVEAQQKMEAEQRQRIAEQQERERQRQRADEERRLAIAKAEAEKARAEADAAKARAEVEAAKVRAEAETAKVAAAARAEADRAKAEADKAQAEATKAKLLAEEEARKNSLTGRLASMFGGASDQKAPSSKVSEPVAQKIEPKMFLFSAAGNLETIQSNLGKLPACKDPSVCAALFCGGWLSVAALNVGANINPAAYVMMARSKIDPSGMNRDEGNKIIELGSQAGKADGEELSYNPQGAMTRVLDWQSSCMNKLTK